MNDDKINEKRHRGGLIAGVIFCSLLTVVCLRATAIYLQDPLSPHHGMLNRTSLFFAWLITLLCWKLVPFHETDAWY